MDKRYGTVAKLQSKLKKLQKIQKKFTGPKDVKIFKGKELDKKLKELGIPKVKKLQSGGRVGAPRGTGAALRGFGKGYK